MIGGNWDRLVKELKVDAGFCLADMNGNNKILADFGF